MDKILCKDITGLDCDFEAKGKTKEEIKKSLENHGEEKHDEMIGKMTDEEKKIMDDKIEKAIKECGC